MSAVRKGQIEEFRDAVAAPGQQDLGFCPSTFSVKPCSQVVGPSARAPIIRSISFSQEIEDGHRIQGIVSAELRLFEDPSWGLYPVTSPCILLAREYTCTK